MSYFCQSGNITLRLVNGLARKAMQRLTASSLTSWRDYSTTENENDVLFEEVINVDK